MTLEALIVAAIEAAKLYLNFALNAKNMTMEEAQAEWLKVNQRAVAARENWQS